jgi:hypothetical protein
MSINIVATTPSIEKQDARFIEIILGCAAAYRHTQRMKHHSTSAIMCRSS